MLHDHVSRSPAMDGFLPAGVNSDKDQGCDSETHGQGQARTHKGHGEVTLLGKVTLGSLLNFALL